MNGDHPMRAFLLLALSIGVGVLTVNGCDSKPAETKQARPELKSSYVDDSVTIHHNLGWLGAFANPVTESISIPDPDKPNSTDDFVLPGAIVIRKVMADQIAEKSGLKVGDVIVRVSDKWLPIKDNPIPDLLGELETIISSGGSEIQLGVLRDGAMSQVTVKHGLTSLDEGLPTEVARINDAADRALQQLASSQMDDGSFGSTNASDANRLRTTALAGLAFLSAGSEEFESQVDGCLKFVASQIDAATKEKEPAKEDKTQAKPGVMVMQISDIDLDVLTSAYVLQFLAESKVQMMSKDWMPRVMGLSQGIVKAQSESGGWNIGEAESKDEETVKIDIQGTHTTNQALIAFGTWESKGITGQPETLTKACSYLKSQYDARATADMDRRTRAALTSGTAAALVAIQCQPDDLFLKQLARDSLERSGDVFASPALGFSGLLSTAVVARAGGKQSWTRFQNAVRVPLLSMQSPDGAFHATPGLKVENELTPADDPHWRAALCTLTLGMQRGKLERLTGVAKGPMPVVRNSAGEKSEGAVAAQDGPPQGLPAGATTFTMDDLSGEGSLEDQVKEKLKEMGLDTEDMEFPGSGSSSSPPPGEGKKKKK